MSESAVIQKLRLVPDNQTGGSGVDDVIKQQADLLRKQSLLDSIQNPALDKLADLAKNMDAILSSHSQNFEGLLSQYNEHLRKFITMKGRMSTPLSSLLPSDEQQLESLGKPSSSSSAAPSSSNYTTPPVSLASSRSNSHASVDGGIPAVAAPPPHPPVAAAAAAAGAAAAPNRINDIIFVGHSQPEAKKTVELKELIAANPDIFQVVGSNLHVSFPDLQQRPYKIPVDKFFKDLTSLNAVKSRSRSKVYIAMKQKFPAAFPYGRASRFNAKSDGVPSTGVPSEGGSVQNGNGWLTFRG